MPPIKVEENFQAIILAAGKGTRMKSAQHKCEQKVFDKAILQYVIETAENIHSHPIFLVIGHHRDAIKTLTQNYPLKYVDQLEQLGTGHAVMQVAGQLSHNPQPNTLILAGDTPLLEAETLKQLIKIHQENHSVASILTCKLKKPAAYGRILKDEQGHILGIREAKDCNSEELKINEVNTGVYIFQTEQLFNALKKINTENEQGEYYLTDVIEIIKEQGLMVASYCCEDAAEILGINSRKDLSEIYQILYERKNKALMAEGVTIMDPSTTRIDPGVQIGSDTIIHPMTVIEGKSIIGTNCSVGAKSYLKDVNLESGTVVEAYSRLIPSVHSI